MVLTTVDEQAIETLPATWPSDRDAEAYPLEATRYADTVRQLTELNQQRKDLRQRVERLRSLQKTVASFQTKDGAGVQENLVTRGGPVEKELEKMRFLLARVAGRVSELSNAPTTRNDDGVEFNDLTEVRKKNIEKFLADGRVFPS
jgi:hypothetical protein